MATFSPQVKCRGFDSENFREISYDCLEFATLGKLCADCYWDEHEFYKRKNTQARYDARSNEILLVIQAAFAAPCEELLTLCFTHPTITPDKITRKMCLVASWKDIDEMVLDHADKQMKHIVGAFMMVVQDEKGILKV